MFGRGWPQLVTPNKRQQSQLLPFRSVYLLAENLKYHLNPSGDADDQTTLESD